MGLKLSGFSRRRGYPRYCLAPKGKAYSQVRLGAWICLRPSAPTPFNRLFRQPAAVSLPRLRIAPMTGNGMLTVFPSASPFGLALGTGLPRDD